MTLEEIKKDVEHCLSLEDAGDPCYHCRQKQWLLNRIAELTQPVIEEQIEAYPAGTDSYGSLPDTA